MGFCFVFGHAAQLVGSQFPDQGLNPGPVSESPEFQARIFPCHILIKQWIGLFLINIKAYMLTILSWDINSQLPGFRFLKFMPCRQVTFFNQESDIIVILVKPSLKRKTETHSHLTEEKLNHKDKKPPETQLMLWDLYMALLRQTCVYILYRHTLTDTENR